MAWSTPKTWIVGAILTAAELNTHLRDQLAYLKGVVDGTNADKIPPAALNLSSTATLPTRRSDGVGNGAGAAAEVAQWRADNATNTNTLRFVLQRLVAGTDWTNTRWRIGHDIDNGNALPAHIDLGGDGGGGRVALGTGGTDRVTVDSAGNTTIATGNLDVAGHVSARRNGAPTGTGAGGIMLGWNKTNGTAEGNIYSDRNTAVPFVFSHWDGLAWVDDLAIASSGRLSGPAFYRSGEVSIADSAGGTFNHGLGARPAFVDAHYGQTTGTRNLAVQRRGHTGAPSPGAVYIVSVDATSIVIANTTGATVYVDVAAML